MSIQTALAKPLMMAPLQNKTPPKSIDSLRPNLRVTVDATIDASSAAKYNDDVNIVKVGLSYLQYWFSFAIKFFFRNTSGKNFSRNESIDVTPPIKYYPNQ